MKGCMLMWKKLIIILFALAGTVTAGIAYYNAKMAAASGSYLSGGNVVGRIHQAPSGISGSKIGLQKGDKVFIGVNNPKDGTPLGWQLIYYDNNYEYYLTTPNSGGTNDVIISKPISGWFSASTEDIGSMNSMDAWTYPGSYAPVTEGKYISILNSLNSTLSGNPLVTYRDLTVSYKAAGMSISPAQRVRLIANIADAYYGKIAFLPGSYEIAWTDSGFSGQWNLAPGNIAPNDLKFHAPYYTADFQNGAGVSGPNAVVIDPASGGSYWLSTSTAALVRPFIMLDLENTVFGIAKGITGGLANVIDPSLSNEKMKLRIYKSQLTAQFNDIQNDKGDSQKS